MARPRTSTRPPERERRTKSPDRRVHSRLARRCSTRLSGRLEPAPRRPRVRQGGRLRPAHPARAVHVRLRRPSRHRNRSPPTATSDYFKSIKVRFRGQCVSRRNPDHRDVEESRTPGSCSAAAGRGARRGGRDSNAAIELYSRDPQTQAQSPGQAATASAAAQPRIRRPAATSSGPWGAFVGRQPRAWSAKIKHRVPVQAQRARQRVDRRLEATPRVRVREGAETRRSAPWRCPTATSWPWPAGKARSHEAVLVRQAAHLGRRHGVAEAGLHAEDHPRHGDGAGRQATRSAGADADSAGGAGGGGDEAADGRLEPTSWDVFIAIRDHMPSATPSSSTGSATCSCSS